jgi:hypothetical protein
LCITASRQELETRLDQIFGTSAPPTSIHRALADIAARFGARRGETPFPVILTAAYDDLMERALAKARVPYDVGRYRPNFGVFEIPRSFREGDRRTLVLKLHGGVGAGASEAERHYAVTEDDFVDYVGAHDLLGSLPTAVAEPLLSSSFLFLGYSLRDWHLRAFLRRFDSARSLRFKSWAVVRSPSKLDEDYWRGRDIEMLDVPLPTFAQRLREISNEVRHTRRAAEELAAAPVG